MLRKHGALIASGVLLLIGLFGAALFFSSDTAFATAGINSQLSFEGKVVKSDGTNITDGTYNMEFKIYQDGSSTGGGTLVWAEDHLVSASTAVTITSGTFQVNLGSVTALNGVNFNQNTLWLSMQVGKTSSCTITTTFQANCGGDGEMSPYIRLTATPYAINAGTVGGLSSSQLVQLTPSAQQTGSINTSGNITSGGTLQGNTLDSSTSGTLTIGSTNATAITLADNTTVNATVMVAPTTASATAFVTQNASSVAILTADTSNNKTQIGSATADANQINLQLDSYNTYADSGTCSTTTNQGAMYYNTATGTMRSCINGSWEDLVSTGGLGLLAFGVIPDSANAASVGDLAGITQSNSPCKTYWASATTVSVAPCYAYSGGRKVAVAATTLSTAAIAANAYVNICLTGTSGQPALVGTGNTTETSAGLPTWSANNPIVCLATLQMSATAGTITGGKIYDIRTFTTTQKTFGTLNTAMALGTTPVQTATANILGAPGAAAAGFVRGVIVAYSGSVSSTTANVVLATAGAQWVKATGTSTVAQYAQVGATNGYSSTSATLITASGFATLGSATRTIDTTCTSNTTCQYSQFLNPMTLR